MFDKLFGNRENRSNGNGECPWCHDTGELTVCPSCEGTNPECLVGELLPMPCPLCGEGNPDDILEGIMGADIGLPVMVVEVIMPADLAEDLDIEDILGLIGLIPDVDFDND